MSFNYTIVVNADPSASVKQAIDAAEVATAASEEALAAASGIAAPYASFAAFLTADIPLRVTRASYFVGGNTYAVVRDDSGPIVQAGGAKWRQDDVGRQYLPRSEFVTAVNEGGYKPSPGTVVTVTSAQIPSANVVSLQFVYVGSITDIPDLPGWFPFKDITPFHFGAVGDGEADDATPLAAARDLIISLKPGFFSQIDLRGATVGIGRTLTFTTPDGIEIVNGVLKAVGSLFPNLPGDNDPLTEAPLPGPMIRFQLGKKISLDRLTIDCNRISSGILFQEANDIRVSSTVFVRAWAAGGYGIGTRNSAGDLVAVGVRTEQYEFGETGFDDQANRNGYGWLLRTADFSLTDCVSNYTKYPIFKTGFGSWAMNNIHVYNGALQNVTDADNIYGLYIDDPRNGVVSGLYCDNAALVVNCDQLSITSSTRTTLIVRNYQGRFTGSGSNNQSIILTTSLANNDLSGLDLHGFCQDRPTALEYRTTGAGSFAADDFKRWNFDVQGNDGNPIGGANNLLRSERGLVQTRFDGAANTVDLFGRATTVTYSPRGSATGTDVRAAKDLRLMADFDNNQGGSQLAMGVDNIYYIVLTAGDLLLGATVRTPASLVSALPASAAGPGGRRFVTDATTRNFGEVVVGGGALQVPVYWDAATTSWRIG